MTSAFDRKELLSAFDEIGDAAANNGAKLHIAVYGGSALMLASNFRFASEDVDIAELPQPWPDWLTQKTREIAERRGWSPDWLNEAVNVHLSKAATRQDDHVEFGSFPRSNSEPGLIVYIPTAEYMLALKIKAIRILDPIKGKAEADDIRNLMKASQLSTVEEAIAALARYFPRSAADPNKHIFLLRQLLKEEAGTDAPQYPVTGV